MKPIDQLLIDKPVGAAVLDYAIEVDPTQDGFNNFNKINETLKRIGLESSSKPNTLVQTCHIYRSGDRYYLMHFLMMFMLGGRDTSITEEDISRTKLVAKMLSDWGLVTIKTPEQLNNTPKALLNLRVVKYKDSNRWTFHPMYHMKKAADKD